MKEECVLHNMYLLMLWLCANCSYSNDAINFSILLQTISEKCAAAAAAAVLFYRIKHYKLVKQEL